MVEEAADLFGGEDAGDALGELGSGDKARRVFAEQAFADAELEEGTESGELAGDGGFFEAVVVEMSDKFADKEMIDVHEGGRFAGGRGGVGEELFEVALIVALGVRGGVALEAKEVEEFFDGGVHDKRI